MEKLPPPSNVPVYAVLLAGTASLFLCLVSWLGDAVIYLVIFAAGIVALGALHFWLWGRGLSEAGTNDEPDTQ